MEKHSRNVQKTPGTDAVTRAVQTRALGTKTKMKLLSILLLVARVCLASDDNPVVAVTLHAQPELAVFKTGKPLPMSVTLTNGLSKAIRFTTFSTTPNDWNGETLNISLVNVYRDKQRHNLYIARPELRVPLTISGPQSHLNNPGESLRILIDISKWRIEGEWIKGEYELVFRMDNISVDDKVTLSVLSDPVHVVVQ